MTDTGEGTSGLLGLLIAIPVLLFVIGIQTVVVGVFVTGALFGVDAVVGVPVVTFGLFELAGVAPTKLGAFAAYGLVVGLAFAVGMLFQTGGNWESDHERTGFDQRFRGGP